MDVASGKCYNNARGRGAFDFEIGGGVQSEALNLVSKEWILAKIGAKELQL